MASEGTKRKLDLETMGEHGEEDQTGQTSAMTQEGAKPTKKQRVPQRESSNRDDPFILPFPRRESSLHTATPGKSILRPERSSHTTTPPNSTVKPVSLVSAIRTDQPDANPFAASSTTSSKTIIGPTSDEEDNITMDGVDRSMEQIEHARRLAVTTLKERGNHYKQRYHATKKQVSDLRLETAEASRELEEALEHKNRKLKEENAGLIKAKEAAENRWRVYKGQFKKANQMSNELRRDLEDAKNQIAYLETLLVFEERSGYSSMISKRQLE